MEKPIRTQEIACGKASRQDIETQTLRRFIENSGADFDIKFVAYPEENDPCDIVYNIGRYQVTEGDSAFLERMRPVTAKREEFSEIRHITPETYANDLLGSSLEKKKYKSDKTIILLIDCRCTGGFSLNKREAIYKKYLAEHPQQASSWLSAFCVFSDGNVKVF